MNKAYCYIVIVTGDQCRDPRKCVCRWGVGVGNYTLSLPVPFLDKDGQR